jgi:His-Xaa-Ser system protein HxsD
MADLVDERLSSGNSSITVQISLDLVSLEAVLKTSYWFSRDFVCDVQELDNRYAVVTLKRKLLSDYPLGEAPDAFMAQAMDFSLRERVTAKTSGIRDLLLAKAFSESGVLEDEPQGIFGDPLEEAKPDGMFKILGNG